MRKGFSDGQKHLTEFRFSNSTVVFGIEDLEGITHSLILLNRGFEFLAVGSLEKTKVNSLNTGAYKKVGQIYIHLL